jgi:hypothetical protein
MDTGAEFSRGLQEFSNADFPLKNRVFREAAPPKTVLCATVHRFCSLRV